jgi:hypothetical protein
MSGWSHGSRFHGYDVDIWATPEHPRRDSPRLEFWGCDIDAPSISWLNQNLTPPFQGWASTVNPPLGSSTGRSI